MYRDNMQYKSNLIFLISFFVLAFIFCCGFYIVSIRQDAEADAMREIGDALSIGAGRIEERINEDILLANAVGIGRVLDRSSDLKGFPGLRVFLENRNYLRVGIVNLNGNIVTSDGLSYNISDERAFQQCLQLKQPFFSKPFRDRGANRQIVVLYVPILDEAGNPVNVISFTRDMRSVSEDILFDLYNGAAHCQIFDEEGNLILLSQKRNDLEPVYANIYKAMQESNSDEVYALARVQKIKSDLADGKIGVIKYSFHETTRYIAYLPIEAAKNRWSLFCIVDESVIMRKTEATMLKTLYLCLAMFALLFIVTFYMFRIKNKVQKGIAALAYTDQLTKIGNVNEFYKKAKAIINQNPQETYSVVVFDVNNFKYINETYGYDTGDKLLIAIAEKIEDNFFDQETCARISNDHFVVLAKTRKKGETRFYEMMKAFIQEQNQGIIKFPLTFSSGIYQIKDREEEIYLMVDKAQLTLKSVKNNRHMDYAYYSERLLERFMENNEIEGLMHEAMRRCEFEVYLQPKFDLNQLIPVGAEALVRWISSEKGFMPPDKFIPLFEKNGFVVKLDFYVLEEVCKMIQLWIKNGIQPLPISVNQSRIHMDDPLYVEKLYELIHRYDIPPNFIELELTESMFFADSVKLVDIMKKMRKIGFLISMDDFGAGYSSLNLLKEIPVDVLKLDKEFLDESANSVKSRIIISQVVVMAKKLGMKVVCEGVETEGQADFLKRIHCDMAQGFLYAKPMPRKEFEEFFEAHRNRLM